MCAKIPIFYLACVSVIDVVYCSWMLHLCLNIILFFYCQSFVLVFQRLYLLDVLVLYILVETVLLCWRMHFELLASRTHITMLCGTSSYVVFVHIIVALDWGVDFWEFTRGGELGRSWVYGGHVLRDLVFVVLVRSAIHNICTSLSCLRLVFVITL